VRSVKAAVRSASASLGITPGSTSPRNLSVRWMEEASVQLMSAPAARRVPWSLSSITLDSVGRGMAMKVRINRYSK